MHEQQTRATLLLEEVTWRCCSDSDRWVSLRGSVHGLQTYATLLLEEVTWRCCSCSEAETTLTLWG
jgi:hypothetical protein